MLPPRYLLAGAAVTAAAAVSAATALAAGGHEQVRFTKAGQTAAKAAVLRRSDLGSTGWTGGPQKPSLAAGPTCANYHPKQSDLVLVGAAETRWRQPGIELDSAAQVLEQPGMVQLDWQRSVENPGAVPCLRHQLQASLGKNARLVSFRRIAFPKLGRHTAAYAGVVSVTADGRPVRMTIEAVLVAKGRTEITLTSVAPTAAAPAVRQADVKLARILVAGKRV